ncbi:succinyldiaminopimelate transaminase, partial [Mycobacterium sp. ITM-2017-0098]
VVEWARERGVLVASDECYLGLGWDAAPISVLHPDVCDGDHTGVTRDEPGPVAGQRRRLRQGMDGQQPGVVAELLAVRKHAGMMVPTPVQGAMVAALDDDPHEVEQRAR